MSGQTSKVKNVPTFLQPNTVVSSRAAIFDDQFNNNTKRNNRNSHSGKGKDQHPEEEENDSEDDEASKAILAKLYGQLQGSIEIKDADIAKSKRSMSIDSDVSQDESSGAEQVDDNEAEDDDGVMEFRLFATQDTPTTILLKQKEPEILYVHRDRADLDESPESERMKHISEAAIDVTTILQQSKMPWERSFFAHKVIQVNSNGLIASEITKKVKKSKRKREWEKKLKAGLIDQATIEATTRKVKVSESWGQEPHLVRKGLDKGTIFNGFRGGRGNRGMAGARGRGMRGGRGGGRGGYLGADRAPYSKDNSEKKDGNAPILGKRKFEISSGSTHHTAKKSKAESTGSSIASNGSTIEETKVKTKSTEGTSSTTQKSKAPEQQTPASSLASKPNEARSALPPKKAKAKPVSKLDNIMAILTGK
ncbi:hypothetical protein BGZ80_010353 [Entomortierella chlamydospora]|uniref:Uncharacterized protein n=1 Tax=Entomortierella chlamydospora TaxID=101097 RepID=A0A9P6MVT7_9FUNG|nr:hypothetical protein BGZ79_009401 [Entomortierella chlamydospora]KAG0014599.1 hypothetical protein BGZ80_010353 [Entomortierella chlamydospora]